MIRLLRAEVARLTARRLFWASLVAAVALVGLFQISAVGDVTPPTAAERVQNERYYQESLADWEANHEEYEQQCADEGYPPEACSYLRPEPSDFGLSARPYADVVYQSLLVGVVPALLFAFLIACSFVGAEFTTGSVANWLTFIPQRGRVFAAKLGVAVGSGVLVAGLLSAVSMVVPALAVLATGGSVTGLGPLVELALRGLLAGAFAAAVGFSVGMVIRNTAAGIGALLGYLFVFLVRSSLLAEEQWAQELTRWSPEGNLIAVVTFGYTYQVPVGSVDESGYVVDYAERTISFAQGLGYWAVLLGALITISLLLFRRRDVN